MPMLPSASPFGGGPDRPRRSNRKTDPVPAPEPIADEEPVAPIGDGIARAEETIRSRDEAVERSRAFGEFTEAATAELGRLQTEDDLSRPDTVRAFGNFLQESESRIVGAHGGSDDSRTRLQTRVADLRDSFRAQAALGSMAAQEQRVQGTVTNELAGLTAAATRDPAALTGLFAEWDRKIDDLAPALRPEDGPQAHARGRGELLLSAVHGLMDRGAGDDVAALIRDDPEALALLTPEQQRDVTTRLAAARPAEAPTAAEPAPLVGAAGDTALSGAGGDRLEGGGAGPAVTDQDINDPGTPESRAGDQWLAQARKAAEGKKSGAPADEADGPDLFEQIRDAFEDKWDKWTAPFEEPTDDGRRGSPDAPTDDGSDGGHDIEDPDTPESRAGDELLAQFREADDGEEAGTARDDVVGIMSEGGPIPGPDDLPPPEPRPEPDESDGRDVLEETTKAVATKVTDIKAALKNIGPGGRGAADQAAASALARSLKHGVKSTVPFDMSLQVKNKLADKGIHPNPRELDLIAIEQYKKAIKEMSDKIDKENMGAKEPREKILVLHGKKINEIVQQMIKDQVDRASRDAEEPEDEAPSRHGPRGHFGVPKSSAGGVSPRRRG